MELRCKMNRSLAEGYPVLPDLGPDGPIKAVMPAQRVGAWVRELLTQRGVSEAADGEVVGPSCSGSGSDSNSTEDEQDVVLAVAADAGAPADTKFGFNACINWYSP